MSPCLAGLSEKKKLPIAHQISAETIRQEIILDDSEAKLDVYPINIGLPSLTHNPTDSDRWYPR